MAKQDEISSTEKLLDLIRTGKATGPESPEKSPVANSSDTPLVSFKRVLRFRKKIGLGVDIGYGFLKLVKINAKTTGKHELVDCVEISFDPDISMDSPEFVQILRSGLKNFCGTSDNVDIWSAIPSENVESRYLKIPVLSRKQMHNAAFWSFKKEVNFNEKENIFDFEIIGETVEGNTRRTELIAYSAPKNEINNLRDLFLRVGFPLSGISIVPFALQNLLRTNWIRTEGEDVCTLFIGRDWSRIAIFSSNNLIISRDIKAGMRSMLEAIIDHVNEERESEGGIEAEGVGPEKAAGRKEFDINLAREKFYGFIDGTLDSGKETGGLTIKGETIFEMILPALDRVIRQVERTLEHYSMNFGGGTIGNIFISGKLSTHRQVNEYIAKQVGLPVRFIDPFAFVAPTENNTLCPASGSARGTFVPAVGIALSDNRITPNFIFTYKHKERVSFINRARGIVFGLFLLAIACCIGVYLWQDYNIGLKDTRLLGLRKKIEHFAPRVDKTLVAKLVSRIREKKHIKTETGDRYLEAAVISEISRITPGKIKLFNITIEPVNALEEKPGGRKVSDKDRKKEETTGSKNKIVVLNGIIYGDRLTFESSIIGYIIKLKKSPIFGEPVVKMKSFQTINDKEVMKFTAEFELI